jgi:hypothetical protein
MLSTQRIESPIKCAASSMALQRRPSDPKHSHGAPDTRSDRVIETARSPLTDAAQMEDARRDDETLTKTTATAASRSPISASRLVLRNRTTSMILSVPAAMRNTAVTGITNSVSRMATNIVLRPAMRLIDAIC